MSLNLVQKKLFPKPEAIIPNWVYILDSIPSTLGFTGTEELTQIQLNLIEAIRSGNKSERTKLATEFIDKTNQIADSLETTAREKYVLSVDIIRAFIYLAAGDINYFFELMDEQVINHAQNIDALPDQTAGEETMSFVDFLNNCLAEIDFLLGDEGLEA